MNDHPLRDLSEQYTCALQNYLKTEGEQALHQAYELGRRAITDGLGVLDIAKIHQQAFIALLLPTIALAKNQRQAQAVEDCFMEALSPCAPDHRGFLTATIRSRELN